MMSMMPPLFPMVTSNAKKVNQDLNNNFRVIRIGKRSAHYVALSAITWGWIKTLWETQGSLCHWKTTIKMGLKQHKYVCALFPLTMESSLSSLFDGILLYQPDFWQKTQNCPRYTLHCIIKISIGTSSSTEPACDFWFVLSSTCFVI